MVPIDKDIIRLREREREREGEREGERERERGRTTFHPYDTAMISKLTTQTYGTNRSIKIIFAVEL